MLLVTCLAACWTACEAAPPETTVKATSSGATPQPPPSQPPAPNPPPNPLPDGQIDSPAAIVTITEGGRVVFNGSGADPDGGAVTFAWDFDGARSGVPASAQEDPGSVTFPTRGTFTVSLTVTDDEGSSDPTPASVVIDVQVVSTPPPAPNAIPLAIDTSSRHQTWVGMEVVHEVYHRDDNALGQQDLNRFPVPQPIMDEIIDDAVDHLGITALDFANGFLMLSGGRPGLECGPAPCSVPGSVADNDNNDPFVLDSNNIRWTWFDPYVESVLIPFKQKVESTGEKFVLTLTTIAWGAWQWHEPASDPGQEYAEIMVAMLDRLKNNYSVEIVPDYVAVYNEPDNSLGGEGAAVVLRGVEKLVTRMRQKGHTSLLRYPDATLLGNAMPWVDEIAKKQGLLSELGVISFHGYGGFDKAQLNALRSRAQGLGIPVIQSEWWSTDYHPPDIHRSMTEADVTQYQPYLLADLEAPVSARGIYRLQHTGSAANPPFLDDNGWTGWQRQNDWYEIAQYSAYIRPGDVRVDISSGAGELLPVAFEKPDGRHAVVIINQAGGARSIGLSGLGPGLYGVVVTSPNRHGESEPSVQATAGNALGLTLDGNSVTTLYPQ